MQKPSLPWNEQPDCSPVCGIMSEKPTSKRSQRLGFTARDDIARSRADHAETQTYLKDAETSIAL